jgi:nucleoside 2-deoxyribosyltransferase
LKANGTRVYLAAPLFSQIERARNRSLRDAISQFSNVYLPQEDGGLILDLVRDGMPVEQAKTQIFQQDIDAITACDVLVIVLDGRTIDEGASFELGYAFALGKVCVGIKTDSRMLLSIGDNPMIECALRKIFHNESELIDWIAGYGRRDTAVRRE